MRTIRLSARFSILALAVLALTACDPKAPVEGSGGGGGDIDAAIAAHAANATTHTNLQVAAANVTGQFGGTQIQDFAITADKIANDSIDGDHILDGSVGADRHQGARHRFSHPSVGLAPGPGPGRRG